jgi:hypothetical protein
MKKNGDADTLGPTGDYPRGKLRADDEGGIQVGVRADAEKQVVMIAFGGPVAWFGLPKAEALAFAEMIATHAKTLR